MPNPVVEPLMGGVKYPCDNLSLVQRYPDGTTQYESEVRFDGRYVVITAGGVTRSYEYLEYYSRLMTAFLS